MEGRRLHFIAIGGAGMSGLALVAKELGAEVSGSDRAESSYTERLRAAGIEPKLGHDADQVPPDADVVVSTAVPEDNPELSRARERGQTVIHRGELLAELSSQRRLLAIAGTHGKTTTTAMCIWALREIGADTAFFLGGELPGAGPDGEPANAAWGEGEWLIAEADESDASFLKLQPEIAVVTNLELDHHSRWGSLAELSEAFAAFASAASGVVCGSEVRLPGREGQRVLRFGLEPAGDAPAPEAELIAVDILIEPGGGSRFRAHGPDIDAEVSLRVPGRHNVANALAALGGLALAGFDARACARGPRRLPGSREAPRAEGRAQWRPHLRRLRAPPDGGHRHDRGGARIRGPPPHCSLPAPPLLADQGARAGARCRSGRRRRGRGPRRLSGAGGARRPARRRQRPDGRRGGGRARRRPARLVAADGRAGRRGARARGCGRAIS